MDVQQLDSRIDQLRQQLRSLPEHAELEALERSRHEVSDRLRDARIAVEDLTREQKKADADVEQVKGRRKRDQDRMDQGIVGSPKDLERMQQELVSLKRRILELEDAELEVMEKLEQAQSDVSDLTAQLAELEERAGSSSQSRDEKSKQMSDQLDDLTAQRTTAAADVPEDLMTLYTRLRTQKGGVGVGALRGRRCGGCALEVTPADRVAFAKAPPDEVLRCEECGRILVRTPESAL